MTKDKPTSTAKSSQKQKVSAHNVRQWLRDIYYVVWSLVGLVLLVAVIAATFTNNSLLNMVAPQTEQPASAQQMPEQAGPTQEQLDCVSKEVGKDRFVELEQGAPAKEDETAVIQACLTQ